MNIEQGGEAVVRGAILEHKSETVSALVHIFAYEPAQAQVVVDNLWASYDYAPDRERFLLLHNDPAFLASELAGQGWSRLFRSRLKRFNDLRRERLRSYSKPKSNARRPRKGSGSDAPTELGFALSERTRELRQSQSRKQTRRVTERQVGESVLRILAANEQGFFTIARLKELLPDFLPLSASDRAPSPTRDTEEVWEQQLRNIVSHRNLPGNIVFESFVTYKPRSLEITPSGRSHVSVASNRS